MSRIVEKLKQVNNSSPRPLGFTANRTQAEKPRLLLIAGVSEYDGQTVVKKVKGADAVLLEVSGTVSSEDLEAVCAALKDIPCGLALNSVSTADLDAVAKLKADFVLISPEGAALALLNEKRFARFLKMEATADAGLLRAASALPVEVMLLTDRSGDEALLSCRHAMLCQQAAVLTDKPLALAVPSMITLEEAKALWSVGVSAVVLPVDSKESQSEFAKLAKEIVGTTFPPRAMMKKREALVPMGIGNQQPPEEEEEEEEDE